VCHSHIALFSAFEYEGSRRRNRTRGILIHYWLHVVMRKHPCFLLRFSLIVFVARMLFRSRFACLRGRNSVVRTTLNIVVLINREIIFAASFFFQIDDIDFSFVLIRGFHCSEKYNVHWFMQNNYFTEWCRQNFLQRRQFFSPR